MQPVLKFALTLFVLVAGTLSAAAADLSGWGIVLLHGKGGGPGGMRPVEAALRAAGASTVAPTMSWSSGYVTYEQALDEVGAYVRQLKGQGAKRIAIVGQSIGANVALGYGAQRRGINAVVAMAPGHQPDRFYPRTQESLERAKAMIAAGHGNETASFLDINQGAVSTVQTTAAAYASFFDPKGKAVISRNAGAGGAKLLWVVGTGDPGAQQVARGGRVVTVPAGHFTTVQAGAQDVVEWLRAQER